MRMARQGQRALPAEMDVMVHDMLEREQNGFPGDGGLFLHALRQRTPIDPPDDSLKPAPRHIAVDRLGVDPLRL
jgi:hypothetical protein